MMHLLVLRGVRFLPGLDWVIELSDAVGRSLLGKLLAFPCLSLAGSPDVRTFSVDRVRPRFSVDDLAGRLARFPVGSFGIRNLLVGALISPPSPSGWARPRAPTFFWETRRVPFGWSRLSLVVLRALTEALLVVVALPVTEVLLEEASLDVVLVLDVDMARGSGEVLDVLVLGGECVLPAGPPAFEGSGSQSALDADPWGFVRVMSLAGPDGRREVCGGGENLAGGLDSLPLLVAVGAGVVVLLDRVL